MNVLPRFSYLFENTENIPLIEGDRRFTIKTAVEFLRKLA